MVGADQRIYGNTKINSPVSYAVAKGGIINLTRYLAAYWHKKISELILLHQVEFWIKNIKNRTL